MRIILLFCLFCSDFNELIAIENASKETRSNELLPPLRKKTNLIDLIDDIQLLIVEQLDAIDLVSLAETTKQLVPVVEHVWKHNNGKKTLNFIPYGANKIQDYPNRIEVDNAQHAHKILEHFGHLTSSITIKYHRHDKLAKEIFRMINFYCAKSLVQFHIEHYFDDFSEFKRPFEKVVEISLKGVFYSVRSTDLSFSEIFPALCILGWNLFDIDKLNLSNERMPHLEEISAEVLHIDDGNTFKTVIKNHPQLRVISLKTYCKNFLELITNEIASIHNLEQLKVDLRQDDIRFDYRFESNHTKRFNVTGDVLYSLLSTNTFGKLHDLEIRSVFNAYGPYAVQFLPIHRESLKRFRTDTKLRDSDIMHLARAKMIFSELEMKLDFGVSVNSLIQLIEKSRFLMDAKIFTFDANEIVYFSEFGALKEKLPAEWIAEEKQIFRTGYIQLHRNIAAIEDEF